MEFYTKHQTLRSTQADAEIGNRMYLFKNTTTLRLTYQIEMLAFTAKAKDMKLIIRLPKKAKIHQTLREFILESDGIIKIERT